VTYRLELGETVAAGAARVAREELTSAIDGLAAADAAGRDKAVHEARKSLKKVRAVLRLVRDGMDPSTYREQNAALRDAGRGMSAARDARVLVDTLDGLTGRFADLLSPGAFSPVRDALAAEHEQLQARRAGDGAGVDGAVAAIGAARDAVDRWDVRDGPSLLPGGLRRIYARGADRFAEARAEPGPERMHEWRKRAKDLWYSTLLVAPAWPGPLGALADEAHTLADHLGDEHDLAVFAERVLADPGRFRSEADRATMADLAERRREELRSAALGLGRRVYAERPKAFVRRLAAHTRAWRDDGGETMPSPELRSKVRSSDR